MRNKRGLFLITTGLLLIAAALCLVAWNVMEDKQAEEASSSALSQLTELIPKPTKPEGTDPPVVTIPDETTPDGATQPPETQPELWTEPEIPDYILNPNMPMPEKKVDGWKYIGIIEIPSCELQLPVITKWSNRALKVAPCRYAGSAYTDDLIICAHNYSTLFRPVMTLNEGSEIRFTDMDGNVFVYIVVERESLLPTDVEEMKAGQWDLTLFTCTFGGEYRITLRCERVE